MGAIIEGERTGDVNEFKVNGVDTAPFYPPELQSTDLKVDSRVARAMLAVVKMIEPFGVKLAIEESPAPRAGTGGATGSKGGGNYDDYATSDE